MLEPPHPASEAGLDAPRPADARAPADHRRADEAALLTALRARDLLALAECWQRTAPAAHAVARRLLGSAEDIEALLGEVYGELWASPPVAGPLERWARARAFAQGAKLLRARGQGPSAPSCALLLPDLPPARRAATDPVERVIAELSPEAALALVRAHDAGIPAAEQPDPHAAAGLEAALEALARQTVEAGAEGAPATAEPLGDMVLGLAGDTALRDQLAQPAMAERVRFLRRGRRRLEGLPPAPELGPRVLLGLVARSAPPAGAAAPHPAHAAPERDAQRAEDDVVITVARQPHTLADLAAPAVPPAVAGTPAQAGPGGAAAAHMDTGPIAVISPPEDHTGFPVWPGDTDPGAPPAGDAEPGAHLPGISDRPREGVAPRVRRGVGMLLIGTALGMLAGAVALLLR